MKRTFILLLALVALADIVSAQCPTQILATPTNGTYGNNGCMFDVVNVSAYGITVTAFDQAWFGAYTTPVAIYTKTGTCFGFDQNAAAWTLLGTSAPISVTATGYHAVPLALNVGIPAGATQGFYITSTNGALARNTAGLFLGWWPPLMTIASDASVRIQGGFSETYPFVPYGNGLSNWFRLWNGRVTYHVNATPGFQINSAQASLDVDGAQGGNCSGGAISSKCVGLPMNIHFASNSLLGYGWEVITSLAPIVTPGGGALVTSNGQIVNVNLADPGTAFLFGLSFPSFPAPFGIAAPATVTLAMPGVPVVSAQMAVLDPSHPDGFRLSQAFELHGLQSWPGPILGPVGTGAMGFTAGQPYGTCAFLAPALPLYGVLQNDYWVTTNGRITWPTGDVSSSPAIPTTTAFLGCWAGFDAASGNITVNYTGTTFTVAYNSIHYTLPNQFGPVSTFTIAIDSVTGVITLSGLTGFGAVTAAMVIGASPANGTNPGPAAFGPGASGAVAAATDAIYRSGTAGPGLAGGANTIVLTPNGSGNYTWASF
jgi:hypothetical protein